MNKRFFLALACLVLAASLTAIADPSFRWYKVPAREHGRINPMAGKPQAVEGGAALFKDHCAQCHGANAQGDGGKKPPLRSNSVKSASDGDLEWFLRQGDIGHGMPSWSSLPQAQRWQIVSYLRSLNSQP